MVDSSFYPVQISVLRFLLACRVKMYPEIHSTGSFRKVNSPPIGGLDFILMGGFIPVEQQELSTECVSVPGVLFTYIVLHLKVSAVYIFSYVE